MSLPAREYLRADYTEVWAPGAVLPLIRSAINNRAQVNNLPHYSGNVSRWGSGSRKLIRNPSAYTNNATAAAE